MQYQKTQEKQLQELKKMSNQNLGIDASSRQYGDAEGRVNFQDVPDKISKIFFGDPQKQYGQDLELMMKLGHGALIIFMILGVVAIIFMVMMLIMSCSAAFAGSNSAPAPYEDGEPLQRSSSRASSNYQNPNGVGRHGVGERTRH